MINFLDFSAGELAVAVRQRDLSAVELVGASLDMLEQSDERLNAFTAFNPAEARASATEIDRRIHQGEDVGPFAGVPLAVKDSEDAAGFHTSHGSFGHASAEPVTNDSVTVARLKKAGCVVVGKTNLPEFGFKATTDNVAFGITRNPWDTSRTCGGSSGGSACAVAAGIVPLATGSDGGGSIRIPSAVCGLPGFKPTTGEVPSADAQPPGWPNLSSRGVIASNVSDIIATLQCIRGLTHSDLRSLPSDRRSLFQSGAIAPNEVRIAWSPTLGFATVDAEIRGACTAVVERLSDSGFAVTEIDSLFEADPSQALVAMVDAFMLRSIEPFRNTPLWSKLDPVSVLAGEFYRLTASPLAVVDALDSCHVFNGQFLTAMEGFDLLICPTTAGQTPPAAELIEAEEVVTWLVALLDDSCTDSRSVAEELLKILAPFPPLNLPSGSVDGVPQLDWTRMTQPFNLIGCPAGTAVAGRTSDGMPIGIQVVGRRFDDIAVLRMLEALESRSDPNAPTTPIADAS